MRGHTTTTICVDITKQLKSVNQRTRAQFLGGGFNHLSNPLNLLASKQIERRSWNLYLIIDRFDIRVLLHDTSDTNDILAQVPRALLACTGKKRR
jgi:hypothetical protein